MARQKQQQQQQQRVFAYSTSLLVCGIAILLLCDVANGSENMNAAGNHNYTMYAFPAEERLKRDAPIIETEVQQSTLVPNINFDTKTIIDKKLQQQQTNNLERNFENPFKKLNIVKRAPNGFIGMRGKKEFQDDEYNNPNIVDWNLDPLYRLLENNERDNYDDSAYYESHRFKKTPIAFYGVRGKKQPNHNGNGHSQLNEMLEQWQREQIRERMVQDFIGRLAEATAAQNEINKRAPTGFTGLRGKRPANDNGANFRDEENDVDNSGNDDDGSNSGYTEYFEKRAPVNAFVGVRGKKDIDNQLEEHQTLFKRSPSESSFGGKRRLADFNNKFVAVRGKKDDVPDSIQPVDELQAGPAEYASRQHLRYFANVLPSLLYGNEIAKRAPSGFVGMRGKRATSDSNGIAVETASGASNVVLNV